MKLKRLGIVCLSAGVLYGGESAATRLKTSAEVLTEIMSAPDKGIPDELLEKGSRGLPVARAGERGAGVVERIEVARIELHGARPFGDRGGAIASLQEDGAEARVRAR